MKKILWAMLIFTIISSITYSKEIFVESYIKSKLTKSVNGAPVFVKNSTRKEFNGLKITKEVLDILETADSPFYIEMAGKQVAMRVGDYFIAPVYASDITPMTKKEFESDYKSKDGRIKFVENEKIDLGPVDFTEVDESSEMVSKNGEKYNE
ncbi:MAG: hypothetical protein LBT51_07695 [Fusobacteriaceae bacterium]|jgi:hypothetical protein|nr:hypothetical protein [Fusobacteriaceae bacterium]